MNIYKTLLISVAALIAVNNHALAQRDTLKKRIIIYPNIIMINPLLIVNGDIPVYYEHVINESFSVEVAPGLTYEDYTQDIYEALFGPLKYVSSSKANLGYGLKAGFKFFPKTKNKYRLERLYLSPELGFRHYSIDYPTEDPFGNATNQYISGYTNRLDIKFLFGGEQAGVKHFVVDWYVGVGLRSTTAVQYLNGTNYNGSITTVPNNQSYIRPALYAGFKMGVGF